MLFLFLGLYLVALNGLTFVTFRADKQRALKGHWRISESTLLTLSFLGGWPAAKLAQRRFRHKTRKEPFRTSLNLTFAGPVLIVALVAAASLEPRVQDHVEAWMQDLWNQITQSATELAGSTPFDQTTSNGPQTIIIRRGSDVSTVAVKD